MDNGEHVENVDASPRWRMPRRGMVKINVHGCFFNEPLENGNISGIGAVVRNSRGKILRMLAGSFGIDDQRINEFVALLEGCKCAFLENWENYVLESDHLDAFWEWRNSGLEGAHPEHVYYVQQLNQRKAVKNFVMEPSLCDHNANELAAYLVNHGAHNYKCMVIIAQPFGRIFELWSLDMGLGSSDPRFVAVHERDLVPAVLNNGEENNEEPEVEDGVQEANGNAEGEMVEVIEIED